jgi:RHS repeat-associated protein
MKKWMSLVLFWLLSLFQSVQAGEITFYHNDAAGTPMMATNMSGAVVWSAQYAPYGERVSIKSSAGVETISTSSAALENNAKWYVGKGYDEDTGLIYMGARYYDPRIGRFYGIDPKEVDEADVHSFNRYAYANNNPYRYVDPDGRTAEDIVFLGLDAYQFVKALSEGDTRGAIEAGVGIAISAIGAVSPVPGTGTGLKVLRAADKAVDAAKSAKQAANLAKHLEYSEKYGKAGAKILENGKIRYYGETIKAKTKGEMAGRRYVHEFDATKNNSRGWHEVLDHDGNVRQVRPEFGDGTKTHYQFDKTGEYIGKW